ncbi:hypothetical protein [Fictibacillus enclensis]|uniref:hypothetical protein n=1 Tax=Fictibacillus enclensis TaxID=1017270 RepID=UPI0024BF5B63|nr:hypothetical protein [Fictibacillus enclensis]WHY74596.1 hypothetical protein QNH15_12100 [Fictibacillus enclensis]
MESLQKMVTDSGIILAVITLISYVSSFLSQFGYLSYYGIYNADFIEVGVSDVIGSSIPFISFICAILVIIVALKELELERLEFEVKKSDFWNFKSTIKINKLIFLMAFIIPVFITGLMWLCPYLGYTQAKHKEDYLTINLKSQKYVLVKKFTDNNALLISADFNDKKILKETVFINLVSTKGRKLNQERVKGGLKSDGKKLDISRIFPRFGQL